LVRSLNDKQLPLLLRECCPWSILSWFLFSYFLLPRAYPGPWIYRELGSI
jgi:hypothetical protein